jgi:signal transduction histidine kinase
MIFTINKLHHKIFLTYSSVFLIIIIGIFVVASLVIVQALDDQIQKEVQELRTRLTHTIDLLRQDIEEKVQREIKDWRVVQAIRNREPYPPSITDSVMDILEYGTDEGIITASKVGNDERHSLNLRHGEQDLEALDRIRKSKSEPTSRLRTPEARATIEITLPIQSEGNFLGFVTGGYFLHEHLSQALKDLTLHPIFLKEGTRLVPLNAPGETIPEYQRESLLARADDTNQTFPKIELIGVPHSVSRIPILASNIETPAEAQQNPQAVGPELVLAYSHRDQIALQQQLMSILLIIGGVGLILVYIVSYIVGLQMTKPINQLAAGVAEIASGNLEQQVAIQSRDEIGRLAGAFNQMAAALKTSLERRVAAERHAARGDAARWVVHEIKNPLFPIRLSIENMQRAYQGRDTQPTMFDGIFVQCTDIVIEEVDRLQRLVDEFDQFARMPPPKRELSDLNQIVQNVVNLYAESVENIQIKANLDPNLPPLSLDSEQITQALGNLIKNAIEAMLDGGALNVLTQSVSERQIQIKIQDTGIGMSPETLAQIFEPYYTTKDTGTGLGMAIVQRIINDHDGEIFVETEEGIGTTVSIELFRET